MDVPRADRQAATPPRGVDNALQVPGQVRPVRIHLHEQRRTLGEPDPKCILIRAAEAKLARPVQHSNAGVGGGKTVGDLPGPIGRPVVDDEHVVPEVPHPGDDLLEVLALVIGGQDDDDLGWRLLALGDGRVAAHAPTLILRTCLNMSSELLIGLTLVGAELRQTTGTSAILTPRFLARYSTSGS